VKFPPKELKDGPPIIAGANFLKLLVHLKEPYRTMLSLIAATGLRIGELLAVDRASPGELQQRRGSPGVAV
jgi:hypothetical protein